MLKVQSERLSQCKSPQTSCYAGLPRFASPPFTVSVSGFWPWPLTSGKANVLVLPSFKPFHMNQSFEFVHTSGPTHGCTFHRRSSVAPSTSAMRPVGSVIWYFGRWLLSLTIPGCFLPPYTCSLSFFALLLAPLDLGRGAGEGWIHWFWCQGANLAGRIASQTTASVGGAEEFVVEGQVATR